MPKVVERDSGRVVAHYDYTTKGSEKAKKHAASDPNLVLKMSEGRTNKKKPKAYAARGGLLTGKGVSTKATVRGAGAAESGTGYHKGCASRPRR